MAVKTVMHTSNLTNEHKLSWTIDNFSMAPLVLQSPPFSAFPGCSEKFCLEMQYTESNDSPFRLDIFLKKVNVNNNLTIYCNLSIESTCSVLEESETFLGDLKERNKLFSIYYPTRKVFSKDSLRNDILIVKATLIFAGYNIKSSISSNLAEKSSADCEDLLKDLRTMYESGFAWDVTFSVDGQTLHAHKAIICSRSSVFKKMFDIEMQEKNSNIVYIKDFNVHVFNCFLLYLYTSIIEDEEWDTVLALYSLAKKYEVESLRMKCSVILGKLGNNLTVDSVCSVLELADMYNYKDVKEKGKKFIQANVFQVVATTKWAELILTKPQLVKEVMEFTK